jgi:hypothetical protein
LAKITNYEAPRYAAFFTLPSIHPSLVQIFHVPTGLYVICVSERVQMFVNLFARLLAVEALDFSLDFELFLTMFLYKWGSF